MYTIQLELSDELAEKLAPYRDKLLVLLELGLQEWLKQKQQENQVGKEHLRQVLAESGKVEIPQSHEREKPYVRHTPVPLIGKPVSQWVIEQRGPL